ncbi:hypothetical protein [Curtobacterium sp. NPDC092190]|uniref:hypothetical protein n=1 Tax=Curtobacterium sp. NPDC092190 TaxID=3363973 RepID=UPI00381B3D59
MSLANAGPWADDFRAALDHGVSGYETKILADGRVTTAEVEDAHEQMGRCLSDSGYTIAYGPDGGFELGRVGGGSPSDDMPRANGVLESCEEHYDQFVTMLFEETRRNPHKQDEAAITVVCLRKAGLVGADYSERKWRDEYDAGSFSFPEFDERAQQCTLDPIGLWRNG